MQQEPEQMTKSPSEEQDEISFVETRTFQGGAYTGMKRIEYPSSEAFDVYRKVVAKYKANGEAILVCLRDKDDQLVKSELINY